MSVLLFLTTFGMVLALFGSAVCVLIWVLVKLWRTTGRAFRDKDAQPSLIARHQSRWDAPHPDHWKRAGQ